MYEYKSMCTEGSTEAEGKQAGRQARRGERGDANDTHTKGKKQALRKKVAVRGQSLLLVRYQAVRG